MELHLIFFLCIASCFSALVFHKGGKEKGLKWPGAIALSVCHTIAGVICVKVFAAIENLIISENGNMSLYGGIFFLPIVYVLFSRLRFTSWSMNEIFDRGALCVVGTLMIVRINCIVSGCCTGIPIAGTSYNWPTREMEIAFWLFLLIYLCRDQKKSIHGTSFLKMMMFYGVFRFFEEFLRTGESIFGIIHIAHIWSTISILIGCSVYFYIVEKDKSSKRRLR